MADVVLSARMHRTLPASVLMIEARLSGQCGGAHAAICPLRGGQALCDGWCVGIASTTATHQAISRLLTSHPQNVHLQALGSTDDCTRATSFGSYRDLSRATSVSSRCISPCSVAQIPAACTTRPSLSLCAIPAVGLTGLGLGAKASGRAMVMAPKGNCQTLCSSAVFQYNTVPELHERKSKRGNAQSLRTCVSASQRKSANRHRAHLCSETLHFSLLPITHTIDLSHWTRLAQQTSEPDMLSSAYKPVSVVATLMSLNTGHPLS
jgi:hypothetical protein